MRCLILAITTSLTAISLASDLQESAMVVHSDAEASDRFASRVTIDGDRAAITAPKSDDNGNDTGSAYIFEKQNGIWIEVAKLVPDDMTTNDRFGSSVSLDGDRLIVSAEYGWNMGSRSGCAYIYDRSATGEWVQQTRISAWDAEAPDHFGAEVSLDGDTIWAAVPRDDDYRGSVRIFQRQSDGSWPEIQRLDIPVEQESLFYGYSVSLQGDTGVVGAVGLDEYTGKTFIYKRDSLGVWSLHSTLTASDAAIDDRFGSYVDLDDGRLVIGASEDDDLGESSGSAYIFEEDSDGNWIEVAKLTAVGGMPGDRFGRCVGISGDLVIVAAEESDVQKPNGGAAFTYRRGADGSWAYENTLIASDPAPGDFLSRRLSVSGDQAILGSFRNDTPAGADTGAAYLFQLPAPPVVNCPEDLDGNMIVSIDDLLAVLNDWGCSSNCSSDINGDDKVDIEDLLSVIEAWGSCG